MVEIIIDKDQAIKLATGSSYKGELNISKEMLVRLWKIWPFEGSEDGKTEYAWYLKTETEIVTIYKWKDSKILHIGGRIINKNDLMGFDSKITIDRCMEIINETIDYALMGD